MSEHINDMEDDDILTAVDEDGNEVRMKVVDNFFYQGEEYAMLVEVDANGEELSDEETGATACMIMKIVAYTGDDGEEYEDFVALEDAKLEEKLLTIATTRLTEDDSLD